jgi:hypothetical protein
MNPIATPHVASAENQRLAAEEAALQLGWLSECPYHGEPFRTSDHHAKDLEAILRFLRTSSRS